MSFPVCDLWLSFDIQVDSADGPTLLSIEDMDRIGLYLNNLYDKLIHPASGQDAVVVRGNGHPFVLSDTHVSCMLTDVELRRLHKPFGHRSTDKLTKLLEKSEIDNIDTDTRRALANIERSCGPSQTYAQKPRRFKFTLRDDNDFNHTVYTDVF